MNTSLVRPALVTLIALLTGACGAAPQQAAVVETRVVTQVVTQIAEVTREVVVTATPRPATPTSEPQPTETPLPAAGKWQLDTGGASSFDDSNSVILALDAEETISGQFDTKLPTLILRCQERQLEAYVVTGLQPDVEADNLDGASVRLRFDKEPAETLNTGKSTDGEALFFEDAPALIKRMASHDTLLFGFTPFSSSPVQTTFDLRGLDQTIAPLYEACP